MGGEIQKIQCHGYNELLPLLARIPSFAITNTTLAITNTPLLLRINHKVVSRLASIQKTLKFDLEIHCFREPSLKANAKVLTRQKCN